MQRTVTKSDTMRIVLLRFGSLTDFSIEKMRVCDISANLRMLWSTVKLVLSRFENRGFRLDKMVRMSKKFGKIPDKLKEIFVSPKTLQL